MTEVFISYCRRNKNFTEKFINALGENGYPTDTIWVDWKDIPPSSKWEDEIRKGVESSNSVVFILSPDWLISNECAKELQIAAEYNKRLFPIICQDIDPKTCPAELASLNWIFFRETDNFDEAMKNLIAAINTDLDWVTQHTAILKQANEWNTKGRDASYLLIGSELQEAEFWLSKATENKQPYPTPLQNEYVFASRKDAVRRQRNTLIGVSVALVVSVALAIAAVVAGIEAMRKSQQALANQLAAQSTNLVNTQPDLSLLLSLEANYIGDSLGESDPTLIGSLVTSMNSSPRLETFLRAHESDVRSVAFSPDGSWLASTGNAANNVGQVFLWDMKSTTKPRPYQKFTGGTQRLLSVDFSPGSGFFAAGGDEGVVYVWDPRHCCAPIKEFPTNGKMRDLKFVQVKGHEYAAVATGNQVTFWDVSSGKMESSLTLQIPSKSDAVIIRSLAFSPAANMLAAGGQDGYVTVWDLNTGAEKFHVCSYIAPDTKDDCETTGYNYVDTDIRGIAFNKNGKLLVSASSDYIAWLWDAQTGDLLPRSAEGNEGGHINTIASVAFSPKTNQIATVSWDNTVRLWNPIDENNKWELKRVDTLAGHSSSIWTAAYSPDGKFLATGSSDKTVILWKVNQISQIGNPIAKMDQEVWALAVSPNGKQFAAGDLAGNIRVWDINKGKLENPRTLTHKGGVLALAYSYDNKWLASSGYADSAIRMWDAKTGKEAWQIENAHESEIWALAFSPDNTRIASASFDKTAKLWDTTTHRQVGASLQHTSGVYSLFFNRDGTQLVVAGYPFEIFLWDLTKAGASPDLLQGHAAYVNFVAPNPKYPDIFASTSDDKTLLIWNLPRKEHAPPVLGLSESMEAVTFRPSGDWLASATNNNTILLWYLDAQRCSENWDKDTCQPGIIGAPLTGHKSPVINVIFLSDTFLVSSDQDGQLIQWNLDKNYWYREACNVINRPLSKSEYRQYIEGKINVTMLKTASWVSNLFGSSTPQSIPPCISGGAGK